MSSTDKIEVEATGFADIKWQGDTVRITQIPYYHDIDIILADETILRGELLSMRVAVKEYGDCPEENMKPRKVRGILEFCR
jgi:hypothetical protein